MAGGWSRSTSRRFELCVLHRGKKNDKEVVGQDPEQQPAQVLDLMEALKASIERAKRAVTGAVDGQLVAHRDGSFAVVEDGGEVPVNVPKTQAVEVRALLELRDQARTSCSPRVPSPSLGVRYPKVCPQVDHADLELAGLGLASSALTCRDEYDLGCPSPGVRVSHFG